MKTRKKILCCIFVLLVFAWIACVTMYFCLENNVKENSAYCMDKIRNEVWEYLENVHMTDAFGSEWVYVYMWWFSYKWADYNFKCKVYNKENVEYELEPLNWDNNLVESQFDIHTVEWRIAACEDRVWFYLNTSDFISSWEEEAEAWASFSRDGRVTREWDWWIAEDVVNCYIDMVDWSVNIEFGDHYFNWELQADTSSNPLFSDEDLKAAEDYIVNEWFGKMGVRIENLKLTYLWDKKSLSELDYCKENWDTKWITVDECVVYESEFYIPDQDAVMAWAFEPDTTLTWYQWYLGRSKGWDWQYLTAGY